jgi:hypothetical protein
LFWNRRQAQNAEGNAHTYQAKYQVIFRTMQ